MALVITLFAISVFLLVEPESFNRVFDVVVPIYTVIALAVMAYFYKLKRFEHLEEDIDDRQFEFKKKSKIENLTWKQKLFGEFVKYERNGMAEYFVFNGAPSFIAKSMANSEFTGVIAHQSGDETMVRISSTGTPAADGFFIKTADSEEAAQFTEYVDLGKPMKTKLWYDESTKTLKMRFFDKKGWEGYQERVLLDDQTMHHKAWLTNLEGKKAFFETFMKRK